MCGSRRRVSDIYGSGSLLANLSSLRRQECRRGRHECLRHESIKELRTKERMTSTALFISPEAPYPPIGGGALRSASLLNFLAQHYAVDMITFREPRAADPRPHIPSGLARNVHVI